MNAFKSFMNNKKLFGSAGIATILIAIFFTINISLERQDPRSKAATQPGTYGYSGYSGEKYSVGGMPTPSVKPTTEPTFTPAPSPTSIPTLTLAPTTPVSSGSTSVSLTVFLQGIGEGGDNVNPKGKGNANPVHPQQQANVEVFNASEQVVLTKTALLTYDGANGNYKGTVDLAVDIPTDVYIVKVKAKRYLKGTVPGINTITQGQNLVLPPVTLVVGDVDGDNKMNLLDYNILMGCYSDLHSAVSCTAEKKMSSDITDDGKVDALDYNLFLRQLANQSGS